jgi:hypothetical protein
MPSENEEELQELNDEIAQLVYDLSPDEPFVSASLRVALIGEDAEMEGRYVFSDGSEEGMDLDEECFEPFQQIMMLMLEEGQDPWKVAFFSLTVGDGGTCVYDLAFEYEDETKWAYKPMEEAAVAADTH